MAAERESARSILSSLMPKRCHKGKEGAHESTPPMCSWDDSFTNEISEFLEF